MQKEPIWEKHDGEIHVGTTGIPIKGVDPEWASLFELGNMIEQIKGIEVKMSENNNRPITDVEQLSQLTNPNWNKQMELDKKIKDLNSFVESELKDIMELMADFSPYTEKIDFSEFSPAQVEKIFCLALGLAVKHQDTEAIYELDGIIKDTEDEDGWLDDDE